MLRKGKKQKRGIEKECVVLNLVIRENNSAEVREQVP